MKEKITITIENLDDMPSVLRSVELLFQKLVDYYTEKDIRNLYTLVLSCSVWFGKILHILGYTEDDFKKEL
jgi:hypothetical protein